MHLVQLSLPSVSFFGAYCGWQHIKMQRKVAMEVYQQQLIMMMEQARNRCPLADMSVCRVGGQARRVGHGCGPALVSCMAGIFLFEMHTKRGTACVLHGRRWGATCAALGRR